MTGFFRVAQCGAILSMPRVAHSASSGSRSYAFSPIHCSGSAVRKVYASVSGTRVTACGVAAAVWTARGKPARSATAMRVVPLPRGVVPTPRPLFGGRQRCRRCHTRADRVPRAPAGLPPAFPDCVAGCQRAPPAGTGGGRFGTAEHARADLASAPRCAESRGSR